MGHSVERQQGVTGTIPKQVDVAIVGSGLVGLFTAYQIMTRTNKTVAVFDRGPIGGVASPRAGGLIRHHYNHPLIVELALRGHDFYAKFAETMGHTAGYIRNGYVIAASATYADWLADNVEMVRAAGVDTSLITPAQAMELIPGMTFEGWSGAIAHDRSAAYAHPIEVMRGLIQAVRGLGVTLISGNGITGIDVVNGHVDGVWTESGDQVRAEVVVNAGGAWGGTVAKMVGLEVPLTVSRLLQIYELRPNFRVCETTPSFSSDSLDLYSRPSSGNRLLVGSRRYFSESRDPDTIDLHHTDSEVASTRKRFDQIVPATGDASVYQAWAGIDGDTPDFQPILGKAPGIEGLMLGIGLSAHGFKLGPIIGDLLADLIIHGEYQALDARALGLERFAEGALFPLGYKQMGA
jgi:sarcosine oxidase subunit beta